MALYRYKAISHEGEIRQGSIEAANEADLESRLSKMKLDLISAKEGKQAGFSLTPKKVERRELIVFCLHMGQLTNAGVPLLDGMTDLRDSMENPYFKEVLANIIEAIEGGKTLSQALTMYPKVFDTLFVNLIHAGEASGNLGQVFTSLSEMIKWQDELSESTKKLLMSPIIVGLVVLGVLFFLMIYLVPQLVEFIVNMGQELPGYTLALIATSNFIVNYWYLCLIVPVLLYVGIKAAIVASEPMHKAIDGMLLRIPKFGPVMQKIYLSRFANYFAMMYAAGVPILGIFEIAEGIMSNRVIRQAIIRAREDIEQGDPISQSLQTSGMFPPLVLRMIKIGETTGQLDKALLNVSYFYERDIKDSIDKLQAMIQPIMTLILGALLGWVMLSVLGPVYSSLSNLPI
ncbi:MAG: type II secretion system F family protein [Porticoccaceae bacterium]